MGLGTDTKSKSYIRIMEGDICSFKLCPETNLLVLRMRSRRQVWSLCVWAQGGKDKKTPGLCTTIHLKQLPARPKTHSKQSHAITCTRSVTETRWDAESSREAH